MKKDDYLCKKQPIKPMKKNYLAPEVLPITLLPENCVLLGGSSTEKFNPTPNPGQWEDSTFLPIF